MNVLGVTNTTAGAARAPETRRPATDTFLQLLVAQLRTQNPLDPQKGTEFVTQLAQFNTLEQLISIRAELAALRQELAASSQRQSSNPS